MTTLPRKPAGPGSSASMAGQGPAAGHEGQRVGMPRRGGTGLPHTGEGIPVDPLDPRPASEGRHQQPDRRLRQPIHRRQRPRTQAAAGEAFGKAAQGVGIDRLGAAGQQAQ